MFLAIGGMTPQVVTESLYCLCLRQAPAFVPTEVHVIVTEVSRQIAELALLHPRQGKFHQFLRDYALEGQITFPESNLHMLRRQDGSALADVRTNDDNVAAADTITNIIRTFTADPECALHVSLTGGRGTMSVYLGYALSLYGRPQDRLSHVLVDDEFSNNHDFYYPPPAPGVIIGNDNLPLSTEHSGLTLAEVPYVSLRHGLPQKLLDGAVSFSNVVHAAQRSISPPRLVIKVASRSLVCGSKEIHMPPQLFAWYAFMARLRSNGANHGGHVRYTDPDVARDFLEEYRHVAGPMSHDFEIANQNLRNDMSKEFFEEKKARVNRWLRDELGSEADLYMIHSSGRRPQQRFGLTLPQECILFE